MRKLCPNFEKENGLETVLEVPVPDEMFGSIGGGGASVRWQNMRSWLKSSRFGDNSAGKYTTNEFMLLLKLVGSPIIPFQITFDLDEPSHLFKNCPSEEASAAKYILQQYIAATGGPAALNSVHSMYAVGQVKVMSSEIYPSGFSSTGSDPDMVKFSTNNNHSSHLRRTVSSIAASAATIAAAAAGDRQDCDVGGFVVWQKNPDLWFLELVVSGCKVSAGCDGRLTWSQSSTQPTLASKGPPRPLRRFFQGLDPRSTASLFSGAVCVGEKTINEEECFVLKRESSAEALGTGHANAHAEVVHHTVWGYFSQRTGLLVQLEDCKLVKMQAATAPGNKKGGSGGGSATRTVFWETTLESSIEDYRYVDGIKIAHGGRTRATLYRYGGAYNHRGRVEESWTIEEVGFNVSGLSMDCFLAPAEVCMV